MDLFAGSGALGIEALSRGAKLAVFCDINYKASNVIKQNLEKTHFQENSIIYTSNYEETLIQMKKSKTVFDLIFIDPPYKQDIAIKSINKIVEYNLLNENGLIVVETDEIVRDIEEIVMIK